MQLSQSSHPRLPVTTAVSRCLLPLALPVRRSLCIFHRSPSSKVAPADSYSAPGSASVTLRVCTSYGCVSVWLGAVLQSFLLGPGLPCFLALPKGPAWQHPWPLPHPWFPGQVFRCPAKPPRPGLSPEHAPAVGMRVPHLTPSLQGFEWEQK